MEAAPPHPDALCGSSCDGKQGASDASETPRGPDAPISCAAPASPSPPVSPHVHGDGGGAEGGPGALLQAWWRQACDAETQTTTDSHHSGSSSSLPSPPVQRILQECAQYVQAGLQDALDTAQHLEAYGRVGIGAWEALQRQVLEEDREGRIVKERAQFVSVREALTEAASRLANERSAREMLERSAGLAKDRPPPPTQGCSAPTGADEDADGARRRVSFALPTTPSCSSPVSTPSPLRPAGPVLPYETPGLIAGLELRLRASIEVQEASLRDWLTQSWTLLTIQARLVCLWVEEARGRRSLLRQEERATPLAKGPRSEFLLVEEGLHRRRTLTEQQVMWQTIVTEWGHSLRSLPGFGADHLALLRRDAVGRHGIRAEEAVRWATLTQVIEASLLRALNREAVKRCALRVKAVWEVQRWNPCRGWGGKSGAHAPVFRDAVGQPVSLDALNAEVTTRGYSWAGPWEVDVRSTSGEDGWEYAVGCRGGQFGPQSSLQTATRRRRWFRTCLPIALAQSAVQEPRQPLPGPVLQSWQEVTGRVWLYTAIGHPLHVRRTADPVCDVEVDGGLGPTDFAVVPVTGQPGVFELREESTHGFLSLPHKETAAGSYLWCGPRHPKTACKLELVYTGRPGIFRIRSKPHRCYWRVDPTGRRVAATAFQDLAAEFCLVGRGPLHPPAR